MPSVSIAQQRLMGQAWAIRKGELKKKDADPEAVKLADSKMKDKDMKAFASTSHKGLPDYVKEHMDNINQDVKDVNESKTSWRDMKNYAESWMRQEYKRDNMEMVLLNVLEGFAKELDERTKYELSPKELDDAEYMLELVQKLMEIVND